MKLAEIIDVLEEWAPKSLQESYDNSGLQIGSREKTVEKALFTLDVTLEVIAEAKENGCDLIIAHHPLIFKPLKKLTEANLVERCVSLLMKLDIALYVIHTNLDNINTGVNFKIAQRLGINAPSILQPGKSKLNKLVVFVPLNEAEKVADAMFKSGAGYIGNYSECSFQTDGTGTFKANDEANPHIGERGKRHHETEKKLEVILPDYKTSSVVKAMKQAHPYEEVAYDIFALNNEYEYIGSGMIGELPSPMKTQDFLDLLKHTFGCDSLKYTRNGPEEIKRVAFCGGSGSFLINKAKQAGADVYITGDVTYHHFFDATETFMIVDIGHYESEQFTAEHLMRYVNKKFPTFATLLTTVQTNPVNTH
ncbi:MAG: Nif3-like dinuclear metal center hexameric protein [Cryomorphaceae bacterium]|nr:Nif3-like dinuclear metal center hexameric protein [Cryomorphaceae bacterium]